jgi:hypothetical protein
MNGGEKHIFLKTAAHQGMDHHHHHHLLQHFEHMKKKKQQI